MSGIEALRSGAPATIGSDPSRPANLAEAAAQFEALLLGQLLRAMHDPASAGWMGTGDDQAGATMLEVAQEHLARVLAAQGGFGLARMVVQGLERTEAVATAAAK
jgi:flagellar protein FlgJ